MACWWASGAPTRSELCPPVGLTCPGRAQPSPPLTPAFARPRPMRHRVRGGYFGLRGLRFFPGLSAPQTLLAPKTENPPRRQSDHALCMWRSSRCQYVRKKIVEDVVGQYRPGRGGWEPKLGPKPCRKRSLCYRARAPAGPAAHSFARSATDSSSFILSWLCGLRSNSILHLASHASPHSTTTS